MSIATATDLRHMTSHSNFPSHRLSQHLRTSPARSPSSIPSSPTSVHSSSSAIFERDIEPLSPPSPQTYTSLSAHPHRIPRSKTTEQIELSVPSVLDSAASILASIQGPNDVAVVAPAPYSTSFTGSGFASPIGSFGSRSPSPTIHGRNNPSLLLSNPKQQQQQQQHQGLSGSPPNASHLVCPTPSFSSHPTNIAPPSIVTPTSTYFSVADGSESASFATSDGADIPATHEHHVPIRAQAPPTSTSGSTSPYQSPSSPPSLPLGRQQQPISATSTPPTHILTTLAPSTSQPHSPISVGGLSAATKRLSFLSYADLLVSTPTSTFPLSSFTTAASAIEPPPHITGVAGLGSSISANTSVGSHPGSAGTSLRGFVINPHPVPHSFSEVAHSPTSTFTNTSAGSGSVDPFGSALSPFMTAVPWGTSGKRDSVALALLGPGHPAGSDDVGGEWEREGLGMGLEERLDVLYGGVGGAGMAMSA